MQCPFFETGYVSMILEVINQRPQQATEPLSQGFGTESLHSFTRIALIAKNLHGSMSQSCVQKIISHLTASNCIPLAYKITPWTSEKQFIVSFLFLCHNLLHCRNRCIFK